MFRLIRCLGNSFSRCAVRPPSAPFTTSAARDSWFKGMLGSDLEKPVSAHSASLAEGGTVYELQFHSIKADMVDQYMKLAEVALPRVNTDDTFPCTLLGCWMTVHGGQDQAVLLWQYTDEFGQGYHAMDKMDEISKNDEDYMAYRRERNKMLQRRSNQIMMSFSFWGHPMPRDGSTIYELRSYRLKPGTLLEWGNHWARGINFRQTEREAVAGFFTQIGPLYQVHHFWAYKNLQRRKEIREMNWKNPGWTNLVQYTTPLCRDMESRIMMPMSFSPLS